ncbi:MAG: hypothetical protein RSD06_05220, partial [Bacilli bacterium]
MKKYILITLLFLTYGIKEYSAKEKLITCEYDKATIEINTVLKLKVTLYDDKSFNAKFIDTSGSYNNGTYGQVQAFDLDGNKTSTPFAGFQGGKNFYNAYKSFNNHCPNVILTSRGGGSEYQFKGADKGQNEGSDSFGKLYLSSPTKEINKDDGEEKPEEKNIFSCSPKSIDSSELGNIKGVTFYFELDRKTGKKIFSLKTSDAPSSSVNPTIEFSSSNSDLVLATTSEAVQYIFKIEAEDIDKIWKDTQSQYFTCPSNIYVGVMTMDANLKTIIVTPNKEKVKDAVLDAEASDGESDNDSQYGSKFALKDSNIDVSISLNKTGCKQILGQELLDWLQWVLDIIRIAGLVLTIVFGIVDFMSASFSSKEDGMKTATKNFSTRLMSLAIIFLVPVIIEFTLGLLNIASTG